MGRQDTGAGTAPGTWYACISCGDDFHMEDGQAAWFRQKGWDLPKRCEACRAKRRQQLEP